jgi:soluble lytic murein transglycosylase
VGLLCLGALIAPLPWAWRFLRFVLHKDAIDRAAVAEGFDPLFVMAVVWAESGFSRSARSGRGAVGLMQLMPETAAEVARRRGLDPGALNLEDPDTNIKLGAAYLAILRREFGPDSVAVLAAYNAGPTKARGWMKGGRVRLEDIPYGETRVFVRRVVRAEATLKRLKALKEGRRG